jgi:hypothetical protein
VMAIDDEAPQASARYSAATAVGST